MKYMSYKEQFWQDYRNGDLENYTLNNIVITLHDGTVVNVDAAKYVAIGNNIYSSGCNANGFALGVVAIDTLQIEFYNGDYFFDGIDLTGATITAHVNCTLSTGQIERFELGNLYIISAPNTNGFVSVNATRIDLSQPIPSWAYLTGHSELINNTEVTPGFLTYYLCQYLGIEMGNAFREFPDYQFRVFKDSSKMPNIQTVLELFENIAFICGGFFMISASALLGNVRAKLITYDLDVIRAESDGALNGGIFDELNDEVYVTGDTCDGGGFMTDNDSADGGSFEDLSKLNLITTNEIINLSADTHNSKITGIKGTVKGWNVSTESVEQYEKDILVGTEGTVFDCTKYSLIQMLIRTTTSSTVENLLSDVLSKVNFEYRTFEADIVGVPVLEPGDLVAIETRKEVFYAFLSDMSFNVSGMTTIKSTGNVL